jgi:hypothetical protein
MSSPLNRLAKSSAGLWAWVQAHPTHQVRFNTLGEGLYFLDKDHIIQRMEPPHLCRPATDEEGDNLHRWLDRDMVQLEERRGPNWHPIHQPKGHSFQS